MISYNRYQIIINAFINLIYTISFFRSEFHMTFQRNVQVYRNANIKHFCVQKSGETCFAFTLMAAENNWGKLILDLLWKYSYDMIARVMEKYLK